MNAHYTMMSEHEQADKGPLGSAPAKEAASSESDPELERLKVEAGVLRAQLAKTLEALNRKREELNISQQISKHPLPIAVGGFAAILAFLFGRFWGRRSQTRRLAAAAANAEKIEAQLALRPQANKQPSLLGDILRSVVVSVSAYVLSEAAKCSIEKFTAQASTQKPVN